MYRSSSSCRGRERSKPSSSAPIKGVNLRTEKGFSFINGAVRLIGDHLLSCTTASGAWPRPEKHQRSELDTFTRRRVRRTGRIIECRMSGKARPSVFFRIEALDQQRLIAAHLRKVVPAMSSSVGDRVGLPDSVSVSQ